MWYFSISLNIIFLEGTYEKILYFLLLFAVLLYLPIQIFAETEIKSREVPWDILNFEHCQYPSKGVISTYIFQEPITYTKPVDKSMDNYDIKKINIKISNFDYFLDKDKNITKGYISIIQPNVNSFNIMNIHNTYTLCTNSVDNKPSNPKLIYIDSLHNVCPIKEINLKGNTNINPSVTMAYEPKDIKLQVYGIPNINATTTIDAQFKEIKGLINIGDVPAAIIDIVMDISCVHDRH